MRNFEFATIRVSNYGKEEIADECAANAINPEIGLHYHFLNTYVMQMALNDVKLREVLNSDEARCVFDGKPLVILSKLFKNRQYRMEQIRGVDFMRYMFSKDSQENLNHFLLGGSVETLETLVDILSLDANIAGSFSPPFVPTSELDLTEIVDKIVDSGANVIWVGLGTPKQDFVAHRISNLTNLPTLCVGAAFDFIAGSVPEASRALRILGLEWLFRLSSDPRRLWRRYLIGNWSIIKILMKMLKTHS